jgi:Polyketide cyclase / dehydrase and lipid transport
MRASAEIVVERPRSAVWAWAADPRHWEHWQAEVSAETAGDRITARHAYGPRTGISVYEVAESTPPRRQVVRSVSGTHRFEGVLELFEDVGGTRVRQTVDVGPDDALARFLFVVARPLVRRGMRRRIAAQLERLKTMVELEAAL